MSKAEKSNPPSAQSEDPIAELRQRVDALQSPPPVLGFKLAPGVSERFKPEQAEDGSLLLRFAGQTGKVLHAGESATLTTGILLAIPDGYRAEVTQRRQYGKGFVYDNVTYLDAAEHPPVEVRCSVPAMPVTAHTSPVSQPFSPGDIIGAVRLVRNTTHSAPAQKAN